MNRKKYYDTGVSWHHYGSMDLPNGYTLCADLGYAGKWVVFRGRLLDSNVYLPGFQGPLALWFRFTDSERRTFLASAFEKLRAMAASIPASNGKPNAQAAKKYPNLVELLSALVDPDGTKRQPSKVTVSFHEGVFKASLNEFDVRASCIVSLPTLDGLLEALEAKLGSQDPEWRLWPAETQPGAFKGKRKG